MSPLTVNERKLLLIALRWRKGYEDSNPDVGMGPFNSMLLDWIIEEAGMQVSDSDKQSIINEFGEYS